MTGFSKLYARKSSFRKRKQKEGESIVEYASALEQLAANSDTSAEELLQHFVENLLQNDIKEKLIETAELDFMKARLLAYGMECGIRSASGSSISTDREPLSIIGDVSAGRDVHIHGRDNYHDHRAWCDKSQDQKCRLEKTTNSTTQTEFDIEDELINELQKLKMNLQNNMEKAGEDMKEEGVFSGDAQTTYKCIKCKNVIAKTSNACKIGEYELYGVKKNPYGYTFMTLTFISIQEYREDDKPPTLRATWFDGYAWTICYCAECDTHIGWKYRDQEMSQESRVKTFFCLTLGALETAKLPSVCA